MDIPPLPQPSALPDRKPDPAMIKAREMEAAFLAEMLAHAGMGKGEGAFSGGEGEAQFASFLRQEQARQMTERGGIGLAELIFNTMTGGRDEPA
jgi:peptidoglycan hydrolase FlgJ